MKRISFTMIPDENGRITVTNLIIHIKQNVQEIKVPDTDITKIPLAALSLAEDITKTCVDGYAEGKMWIGGKCREYQFTLVFK